MKCNILIVGASGFLGNYAINFLLGKGYNSNSIIALVRDESKVQHFKNRGVTIRKADYNDPNSLTSSFIDIKKILFISSNDLHYRKTHHLNIVNAAKKSNVKFIAYTSFIRKHNSFEIPSHIDFIKETHIGTEKLLKESGIPHTILVNGLYCEGITNFFFNPLETVINTGVLSFPAGNGLINYTTREDLAEAAVNVVLNSDDYIGKTLYLNSKETHTLHDVADILCEITGKKIQYISPTAESYKQDLMNLGKEDGFISFSLAFALAMGDNEFYSCKSDLLTVLKRNPTSLKEFLSLYIKQNYEKQIN
ncbi:hypothetical protein DICPUDRAFT_147307 [Dictyostelium purpureum]|uniref:NmrA-like domain-containing protein n=1 Tax=Dictyostelium purpureum TaxID=5786 RepID=F0Z861_DICPU|nr:uncharacterized protein DICPUDRAFT_147307 [Dictyostelium purpureum]EGC39839.1 hypothetical protein DICPUDRAFT_147307 [Dictyostelium purpureum]|eukprot:XP_003283590.1 hypothetical protein DICPUDRAFT_147307 [Dictyostelium purpureum]